MTENEGKFNFKKLWCEIKDMLSGAAFPFILMAVLSATIIQWADSTEDAVMRGAIVVVGEVFLIVAYVIFGKQNGVVAYRKTAQQSKKRELGSEDIRAAWHTGEYALYKGFVIGFIPCIPYVIFEIIECSVPNSFCRVVLSYGFGWAYYPFRLCGASGWFGLLLVIPLTCVHALAYFLGARGERIKQEFIANAQSGGKGKKGI